MEPIKRPVGRPPKVRDLPPSCGECCYWEQAYLSRYGVRLVGFCHRYPPPITRLEPHEHPVTMDSGWCGEYGQKA